MLYLLLDSIVQSINVLKAVAIMVMTVLHHTALFTSATTWGVIMPQREAVAIAASTNVRKVVVIIRSRILLPIARPTVARTQGAIMSLMDWGGIV